MIAVLPTLPEFLSPHSTHVLNILELGAGTGNLTTPLGLLLVKAFCVVMSL